MSYAPCNRVLQVALSLGALLGVGVSLSGCIEDADCGVCDPDNLILESISGVNYTSDKIHILSPPCEGDRCPSPFTKGSYFIEDIGPCEETEEAQATPSAEEYCKISPLVTAFGIEFVFNNLLNPTSVELVRKRPDNPQLFEVYDWKVDVLHIEGPITRWNGDYNRGAREQPDVMTRMVNLSCVDNLRAAGVNYGHEQYEDPATNPCNDMAGNKPLKMFENGELHSYRGIWSAWGSSCSSPQEGPDTCCTWCEWLLTTKVERYGLGLNADGVLAPLNPLAGTFDLDRNVAYGPAIVCRPGESDGSVVDTYAACAGFIASVDRSDEEQRWVYEWCVDADNPTPDCEVTVDPAGHPLPRFDRIRETHPSRRPRIPNPNLPIWQWKPRYEKLTAPCRTTVDCGSDGHDLSGTSCIGTHVTTHEACLVDAYPDGGCTPDGTGDPADPTAVGGYCRPSWTTVCADNADTVGGGQAYCMDRRFGPTGSAACRLTTDAVESGEFAAPGFAVGCEDDGTSCDTRYGGGRELAHCDWNENGRLTAAECCVASIAGLPTETDGAFACNPFYQTNLVDKPLYQRDSNLPQQTKNCRCPTSGSLASHEDELRESGCYEPVETGCYDNEGELREDRAGDYAVKFVTRVGGVVYDPAVKGIDWRPADTGGVPRADIEQCAMDNVDRLIAPLNRHDGWRANDPFTPETFEEFDRAMCSGQEYRVVFNEPGNDDNPAYIVDKVGNTLEGKSVYTFETPQFHVVPGSGFPTDNLRIGACDDFSIRFSNKYDVSPENLEKVQLFRVACEETNENGRNVRTCQLAAPDSRCDRDIDGDGVPDPPEGACCDELAPGVYPPVGGGPGCYETQDELTAARQAGDVCARPCLTVDVENQFLGELRAEIDPTEFKQVLENGEVYRMIIPAAARLEDAVADPAVYDAVFWDVCGMPLVNENAVAYTYEFRIDDPKCKEDEDRDGIPFSCDNADRNFNPTQADIDADGIGDITDLCPVAGGDPNNTADSDNDGVGNICDNCRQTLSQYNDGAELAGIPAFMQVRNIPHQGDADEDGIGDVCDNCVWVPNCESYGNTGTLTPYEVADPIAFTDDDVCQRDTNTNFIGDLCEMEPMRPDAAGPIGFGNADDFDQDGITNMVDKCPRQPLHIEGVIECTTAAECPAGRTCDQGLCNHLDSEMPSGDGVGDICDTCPFSANPNQTLEGGMQEDDEDEDFVGLSCETDPACAERKDPRPFSFFRVQANGNCCTTQLVEAQEDYDDPLTPDIPVDVAVGDLLLAGTCENAQTLSGATCTPLRAPHPETNELTLPVRVASKCMEEQVGGVYVCRQLPPDVENAPGILVPPPGCEEALAAFDGGAGLSALENLLAPLTDTDFGDAQNPFDALWQNMCFLPQVNQDYDGLGDPCDLCPFAYDPANTKYIDVNGRLWPNDGAFCNGDYLPDNVCEAQETDVTAGGMDESGGSGESGSGSGSGGSAG